MPQEQLRESPPGIFCLLFQVSIAAWWEGPAPIFSSCSQPAPSRVCSPSPWHPQPQPCSHPTASRVSWRAQPQLRALSPQSSQISAPNPRRLVSRRWSHIARAAEPQPTHKFVGNKTWHGARGTCSHCWGDVPSPAEPPAHPGSVPTGPWGHDGDQAGPAGQGGSPRRGLQGRSSHGAGCPGLAGCEQSAHLGELHKRAAFLAGGKTSCAELGEPPRS